MICGCDNCKAERKELGEEEPSIPYMVIEDDGNILGCGNCGFIETRDWWEDVYNRIIDQEIVENEIGFENEDINNPEYKRMMNWMWN